MVFKLHRFFFKNSKIRWRTNEQTNGRTSERTEWQRHFLSCSSQLTTCFWHHKYFWNISRSVSETSTHDDTNISANTHGNFRQTEFWSSLKKTQSIKASKLTPTTNTKTHTKHLIKDKQMRKSSKTHSKERQGQTGLRYRLHAWKILLLLSFK